MKLSTTLLAGLSLIASLASLSAGATSPNTTAATSVPYEVNQGWVTHYFDETIPNRWFRFGEVAGHSYCVEAVQGSFSPIQLDPNLTIYTSSAGTTTLTSLSTTLSNDNGGGDPNYILGSRICYISPVTTYGTTTVRGVKLNVPITTGSGDAGYIRVRIVDTTLIAKDSYALSTSSSCNTYLTYGYVLNTANVGLYYQFSIPSASYIGSTNFLAASAPATMVVVPNPGLCSTLGSLSGPVLLAHNGPPDAVQAYHYYYVNWPVSTLGWTRAEYSMK